jgi:hypothetical protein
MCGQGAVDVTIAVSELGACPSQAGSVPGCGRGPMEISGKRSATETLPAADDRARGSVFV